jgi:hypothetical protein
MGRAGKATGSRERAPDDRLRERTIKRILKYRIFFGGPGDATVRWA